MAREIDELRAKVMARHKAATRKVSRLKNVVGVEVSGTKVDPRRSPAKIRHYTTAQLNTYMRELDTFTSRSTQFVPDARRKPMSADKWHTYQKAELAYNQKVKSDFSRIEDIYVPRLGMTIGERMDMVTPKHRQAYNPAVNAPYEPPTRKPTNVMSEKALEKLTAAMVKRGTPEHNKQLILDAREQFSLMAEVINEPELRDRISELTDTQFLVAWNYTPLPTALGMWYDMAQAILNSKEQAHHAGVLRNSVREANELIAWAKSLDLSGRL